MHTALLPCCLRHSLILSASGSTSGSVCLRSQAEILSHGTLAARNQMNRIVERLLHASTSTTNRRASAPPRTPEQRSSVVGVDAPWRPPCAPSDVLLQLQAEALLRVIDPDLRAWIRVGAVAALGGSSTGPPSHLLASSARPICSFLICSPHLLVPHLLAPRLLAPLPRRLLPRLLSRPLPRPLPRPLTRRHDGSVDSAAARRTGPRQLAPIAPCSRAGAGVADSCGAPASRPSEASEARRQQTPVAARHLCATAHSRRLCATALMRCAGERGFCCSRSVASVERANRECGEQG
jgi:hypothetical protein